MTETQQQTIQAGVIQCFELTYERAWKYMKRWLDYNLGSVYVDGVSRKGLYRLAAETASEVYQIAPHFLQDVQALHLQLQQNNE